MIGDIKLFAGTFAPQGWALCNGALMSIMANQALFAVIGTTYGGNGETDFALPNLAGVPTVEEGGAVVNYLIAIQ
jgi:microcystin-dependent protein